VFGGPKLATILWGPELTLGEHVPKPAQAEDQPQKTSPAAAGVAVNVGWGTASKMPVQIVDEQLKPLGPVTVPPFGGDITVVTLMPKEAV